MMLSKRLRPPSFVAAHAGALCLAICVAMGGVAWAADEAPNSKGSKGSKGSKDSKGSQASKDSTATRMPPETEIAYYYDYVHHMVARPIARQLDLGRAVRRLSGRPREAVNVDSLDQVRLPSTWWTPRLGYRPVSVEQMLRGPGPGTGPAPGKLSVTRVKTQGVTPGFFIKDSEGTGFLLKFDPPGLAEMATGADAITTYLYWAAGYNVPDNTILTFTVDDLEVAKGAQLTDTQGKKHVMTRDDLVGILAKLTAGADGRYRALASRLLEGKPIGPFEYSGRRRSDPEDLITHEHRRELRGMFPMAAWTNHADARSANSLDVWVKSGGRSFVRHYLIDFGSCLGSSAIAKRAYQTGTEYFFDYGVTGRQMGTLGLAPFAWEDAVDPDLPSVGYIESRGFDPAAWRPYCPNAAFDARTDRDLRWGARIVAAFTDDHIRAAVAQARFTDPRAVEYLARVMIERRDKIVERWLGPNDRTGALMTR